MTATHPTPERNRSATRRWGRRLLVVLAVALSTAAALAVADDGPSARSADPTALQLGDGTRAAPFRLPDLARPGRTIALTDYAGTPLVLNFWASWCGPCRKEMPALQRTYEQLDGKVELLGVNHEDNRRAALELADQAGVTYPSAYDPDGDTARRYGLYGMPTTLFITSDGTLAGRRTGEMDEAELEQTVRDLLLT